MATQGYEEDLLQRWFPTTEPRAEPKQFAETDISTISAILERAEKGAWSRIPRIYIVLRLIGNLEVIDDLILQEVSDTWLPFTQQSLPDVIRSQARRTEFLHAQRLVYNSKALDLERGRHGHFHDASDVPLKKIGDLGKGGSGFVERVISTVTYKEYALKLIKRGQTFRKDKKVLRDFEKELSNLKKVSQAHRHIIDLIGSYTEPKYVGILFPVADCDLGDFMELPDLGERRWTLRRYFGCLASALAFIHNNNMRHKDIKPQNILVKDNEPYFTDFGLAVDWAEVGHSTTQGPTGLTPRYSAPEVAAWEPRNSSSDTWSLGCVFLEMLCMLKSGSLLELRTFTAPDGQPFPYHSPSINLLEVFDHIEGLPGPAYDNLPLAWIKHMLQRNQQDRWSMHSVLQLIQEHGIDASIPFLYIGRCCLDDEESSESVVSYLSSEREDVIIETKSADKQAQDTTIKNGTMVQASSTDVTLVDDKTGERSVQHNQPESLQAPSSNESDCDAQTRLPPTSHESNASARVEGPNQFKPKRLVNGEEKYTEANGWESVRDIPSDKSWSFGIAPHLYEPKSNTEKGDMPTGDKSWRGEWGVLQDWDAWGTPQSNTEKIQPTFDSRSDGVNGIVADDEVNTPSSSTRDAYGAGATKTSHAYTHLPSVADVEIDRTLPRSTPYAFTKRVDDLPTQALGPPVPQNMHSESVDAFLRIRQRVLSPKHVGDLPAQPSGPPVPQNMYTKRAGNDSRSPSPSLSMVAESSVEGSSDEKLAPQSNVPPSRRRTRTELTKRAKAPTKKPTGTGFVGVVKSLFVDPGKDNRKVKANRRPDAHTPSKRGAERRRGDVSDDERRTVTHEQRRRREKAGTRSNADDHQEHKSGASKDDHLADEKAREDEAKRNVFTAWQKIKVPQRPGDVSAEIESSADEKAHADEARRNVFTARQKMKTPYSPRQRNPVCPENEFSADEKARYEAGYQRRRKEDQARQRASKPYNETKSRRQQDFVSYESSADEKARYEAGYRRRKEEEEARVGRKAEDDRNQRFVSAESDSSVDHIARYEAAHKRRVQEEEAQKRGERPRRGHGCPLYGEDSRYGPSSTPRKLQAQQEDAIRYLYKSRAQVDKALRPEPSETSSRDYYDDNRRIGSARPRSGEEQPESVQRAKEPRPSAPGKRHVREVRPTSIRSSFGVEDVRYTPKTSMKENGDVEKRSKSGLPHITYPY